MSAQAPPESLTASATIFLRRHPPFDAMEDEALRLLASRLALGYYPAGATILSPDQGEPQFLYIVRSGRVRADASADRGAAVLAEGECFAVDALLERRSTAARYAAAADTFCYQLPAADFAAVLDSSRRFREFSTEYLASLLR